jgi:hypothetical protein
LAGVEIEELFVRASDTVAAGTSGFVPSCFAVVMLTPPLRFARRPNKSKTSKHKTTTPPMSNGNQFSFTHNL